MEHVHNTVSCPRVCLVNTMLWLPVADPDEVAEPDWTQYAEEAASRARGEKCSYSDEPVVQAYGPLQRILIPKGHSRQSGWPLMRAFLKGRKAARNADFVCLEDSVLKGHYDEAAEYIPLDLMHLSCTGS